MKNLLFVISLSLVAVSAGAQNSASYYDFDTILIKTEAGYDTLVLPTDNQIFSGTEARLDVNYLEKYFVVSIDFPDGTKMDYRIQFPINMKEGAEVNVLGWSSTRPIAKKISTKIDFEIDGEVYVYTSGQGWE